MTDLERWRVWLAEFGIVFEEEIFRDADRIPAGTTLAIEANTGPKNDGYTGFMTVVKFDRDGVFVSIGAYE